MSEIIVAYWSGTGNTELMAQAVGKGIEAAGKTAQVLPMETITPDSLKDSPVWVLGCPAMGAEELEEGTVEPFVTELEAYAQGKKVALFGSYDWGDGEWMRLWAQRMEAAGASIIDGEGLICQSTPGADALDECETLGRDAANS